MGCRYSVVVSFLLSVAVSGCASSSPSPLADGERTLLEPVAINPPLPRTIQARNVFLGSGVEFHWLEETVGAIYEVDDQGRSQLVATLDSARANRKTAALTDPALYHARVDNGFTSEANVFIVAGNLGDRQVAEVTVADVVGSHIEVSATVLKELRSWSAHNPNPNRKKRVFVHSAVLTLVTYDVFERADAGGSVTGAAFRVKSNIYHETGSTNRDYVVTVAVIDPDAVRANWEASPEASALERMIRASTVEGLRLRGK